MYRRVALAGAWRDGGRGEAGSSGTSGRSIAHLRKMRAAASFLVALSCAFAVMSAIGALRRMREQHPDWLKVGQELPRSSTEGGQQLGLSPGNYSLLAGSTCLSCAERIQRLCGFRISGRGVWGRWAGAGQSDSLANCSLFILQGTPRRASSSCRGAWDCGTT